MVAEGYFLAGQIAVAAAVAAGFAAGSYWMVDLAKGLT